MHVRNAALAISVLAVPSQSWASPVNMERIASTSDTRGWNANADLSGGVKEGNIDKREIKFNGGVQYRTFFPVRDTTRPPFMRDRWLLSSSLALVKFSGSNITDNGFMHVRYTRMMHPRVGAEVFVQAQYNAFTNLRARMLTGGGARVLAIHRNLFGMWAGSGYMIEYEVNAIDEPGDRHPAETYNHRWTSYLSMQLDVLEQRLAVGSTTYVQPRFDDFGDIRVLTGLQLEGKVTPFMSLGSDLEVRYDSRPPGGVEQTDITYGGFLRLRFG